LSGSIKPSLRAHSRSDIVEMTAFLTIPARASLVAAPSADARAHFLVSIRADEARARQAAEQGDLAQAARFILAALDGERRMAASGPQVLQLIKPRG
jgi:hypothetical protein